MSQPTYAKVSSLTHWKTFFHPITGIFRLPNIAGANITHLDIDLRYVDHEHDADHPKDASASLSKTPYAVSEAYLPNVVILTLRGAEHCHDQDERMDELADILLAIKPMEVRWLNATSDPTEQLTFSTHLVHPAIIAAGEIWARTGGAQKIVMQGGFPCPNLSAPTPYSLTPAATPCPSPGANKTSFGAAIHSLSTLPVLSTTKPKPIDEQKAKERAERKRLAEYSLKPRFEFAFGTWGSESIEWRFDGRYTPACILASIEHLLRALDKSFPYASAKADSSLPALLAIAPVPFGIVDGLRGLIEKLDLDEKLVAYLADATLIAGKDESTHARVFDHLVEDIEGEDKTRQSRRLKADMLLLSMKNNETTLVSLDHMLGRSPHSPQSSSSMSESVDSILPDVTYATTEDGDEAMTPEMGSVTLPIHSDDVESKKAGGENGLEAPVASLII